MNTGTNPQLEGKLINTVHDEVKLRPSFLLLLVFSTIIATLGLLIDSTAVVIGAMLISPLFWPIAGVTIGLITTKRRLASKALIALLISLVTVFVVALLVAWVAPFTEISHEIDQRTHPTLIDLFIALATSVIAMIALYYPRISQTATGVAISIALLPALCVAGIGVAFGSLEMFLGAMLLFGTNIAAMIFAGVITLYVLNVRPHRHEEETRLKVGFFASLVLLILLSIPLSIYLRDTIQQARISVDVERELIRQVSYVSGQTDGEDIRIIFPSARPGEVDVEATAFFPEGEFLTQAQQNNIVDALAQEAGRTINLQLNVLNTVVVRQQEDEEKREQKTILEAYIHKEVLRMNPDAHIQQVDIQFSDDLQISMAMAQITIVLKQVNDEQPLTFEQKEELRKLIQNDSRFVGLGAIQVAVDLIPVRRVTENQQAQFEERVDTIISTELQELDTQIAVGTIEYTTNEDNESLVTATVYVPNGVTITAEDEQAIEQRLQKELNISSLTLTLRILRFDSVESEIVE